MFIIYIFFIKMDSFTITFSGTESELKSVFFPPIELNDDYVIGLVDFQSYNSIFNVKKPLNTLSYYKVEKITLPKGEISVDDLNNLLKLIFNNMQSINNFNCIQ